MVEHVASAAWQFALQLLGGAGVVVSVIVVQLVGGGIAGFGVHPAAFGPQNTHSTVASSGASELHLPAHPFSDVSLTLVFFSPQCFSLFKQVEQSMMLQAPDVTVTETVCLLLDLNQVDEIVSHSQSAATPDSQLPTEVLVESPASSAAQTRVQAG